MLSLSIPALANLDHVDLWENTQKFRNLKKKKREKKKFVIQTRNPPPLNPADLYKPGFSQSGLQTEQQTEFFPSQVHQSRGAVLSEVLSWSKK